MKKAVAAGVVAFALVLCACHRDIQNTEAVRQGMMKYLSKRTDLSAMDVSIASVSFRGDEADAMVHFQSRNSNAPGTGLDMGYVLERHGNEWVVKGHKGGTAGGANPHGSMGGGGMSPGQLPPGHPAIPPQPAGRP